jgi:hypothetical protein
MMDIILSKAIIMKNHCRVGKLNSSTLFPVKDKKRAPAKCRSPGEVIFKGNTY